MCAHLCRLVRQNGKQVVWGGASFVHRRVTSSLGLTCVGTSGAHSIATYSRLNNGDVITTRHNIIIIIIINSSHLCGCDDGPKQALLPKPVGNIPKTKWLIIIFCSSFRGKQKPVSSIKPNSDILILREVFVECVTSFIVCRRRTHTGVRN